MSTLNRRRVLQGSLAGAGPLGLRAMATGLPISFLLEPKSVKAEGTCGEASTAQFLILSMSAGGGAAHRELARLDGPVSDLVDVGGRGRAQLQRPRHV